MELNLNGRIVGRLNGRILVALTAEEYLDALPEVGLVADRLAGSMGPVALEPSTPALLAQAGNLKAVRAPDLEKPQRRRGGRPAGRRAGRPPGTATPAQRAFNTPFGKPARVKRGEVAKLAPRECPYCSAKYEPVRRDQTFCLRPACKKAKDAAYRAAHKWAGGKPAGKSSAPADPAGAPSGAAGHMTPAQRAARLDVIRRAAAKVGLPVKPRASLAESTGVGGEVPPELRDAAGAAARDE